MMQKVAMYYEVVNAEAAVAVTVDLYGEPAPFGRLLVEKTATEKWPATWKGGCGPLDEDQIEILENQSTILFTVLPGITQEVVFEFLADMDSRGLEDAINPED